MSRGSWESAVARADALGAARKARKALLARSRLLTRKRAAAARRTAADRRKRAAAEARALPPVLADAYRVSPPEVRILIREQARDAARPFDRHGIDFDAVLAVRGGR